jgi:hypothetical protein
VNWGATSYSSFSNYVAQTGMDVNSIYADPLLSNPNVSSPVFYLLTAPFSSCIDAGDPSFIAGNNETDYFGGTRVLNFVDIGANEAFIGNSISENNNKNSTSVYPNPSSGEFAVYNLQSPAEIQFYNCLGEKVFETTVMNKQAVKLNAGNGIYLYKLFSGREIIATGKLVIQ